VPVADQRIPLVLLCGISDTGRERISVRSGTEADIVLTGTSSFEQHLTPGRFEKRRVWLDGNPKQGQVRVPPGPLVNYIADPDSHGNALVKAVALVEQLGRPCFNPPRLVARTQRDEVARRLTGIPGLRVPATVRLTPTHPRDFPAAVETHGLSYPVIVRLAGDHGGVSMVRIDGPSGWDAVFGLAWGGRAVYLTEFVDYRDGDGFYRKHRIALVRGEPLPRHVVIGNEWLLHVSKRLKEQRFLDEEIGRLQRFDAETLPAIRGVLSEIHRRIGLDYFGVDCHLADDGTLTLFEANATMNILFGLPSPNHWDAFRGCIRARLEEALLAHARQSAVLLRQQAEGVGSSR
jgi:hypothetical protein